MHQQQPVKPPLLSVCKYFPFLIIAIILILLPYYLVESHQSKSTITPFRFTSDQIISPIAQNQNLRYITLSNSLEALLVSDPSTTKSGCAIQVRAGSSNEPKEINGLAHFLEHMLFQGSAKYPANDHFDDFLSRNNGMTNAFTADTVTIFYFDVDGKAFEDGLDIFSHFFIDARLDPAAVDREIYAVNNEYQIDLMKNDWRFMELLKKLANKENPYHRFTIGNYKTLKTIPESKNISLYAELRKFYETHYSSEKLTVTVISSQTLDELESLVTEKFSSVPKRTGLDNNTNSSTSQELKEKTEEAWNLLNMNMKNNRNSLKKRNDSKSGNKKVSSEEKHWNFLRLNGKSSEKLTKSGNNQKNNDYPAAFTQDDLGKFVWYKTLGNHQELSVVFMMNFTVIEDPFTRTWDYLTELISNDYPSG